jgi:transcriptional regulator with XRE-family HTH domain
MRHIKLANQFKEQRIAAGLTQEDLAGNAHVTRMNVHDLETGKNVGFHIVAKIMAALSLELAKRNTPDKGVSANVRLEKIARKRVRNPKVDGTTYPQLRLLLWDRNNKNLTEKEAFYIYEKNARYLERDTITTEEARFLDMLTHKYGNGVML